MLLILVIAPASSLADPHLLFIVHGRRYFWVGVCSRAEWKAIRFVWVVGAVARIKGITSPPPLSFALSAPLLPLKTFHKTKQAQEALDPWRSRRSRRFNRNIFLSFLQMIDKGTQGTYFNHQVSSILLTPSHHVALINSISFHQFPSIPPTAPNPFLLPLS